MKCNRIFASLISNKIFKHINQFPESNFIDFSNSLNSNFIKMVFQILRGKSIWLNESNQMQLLDTITFLECNLLSVFEIVKNSPYNFVSKDISSLNSLPIDLIQEVISSFSLHLKNETQLFEFVKNLIK
jgi:hypothetical protein